MNFTADRDEFAASQSDIQVKDESYLIGSARRALRHFGDKDWFEALLNRVEQVARTAYRRESGHVSSDTLRARIKDMRQDLTDSLSKTKDPEGHIEQRAQALAKSLASLANAVGIEAASHDDENDIGLEWVTMHDDKVRTTHREVDGQVRRPHEKYDVGGYKMSRPGDTRVPIELWINCRCALRPVRMDNEAITASTISAEHTTAGGNMDDDTDEMLDDNIDDIEAVDDFQEVRFHGVLAPEGVLSGDGRKFREGVMRWRDLPIPMAWQKVNLEGHDGSVVVGHIDDIWRDENNLLQYEGGFTVSAEADEAISLVADRSLRGVSVDVDDATMSFEDEDGNEVTFDSMFEQAAEGEDPGRIISVISDGRVCGATMCAIPAFQEAYIAIGPHPDKAAAVEMDEEFRFISSEERDRMAKNGQALPDGSYPIANEEDLRNAIQAIGRAPDPAKAKAHIKKRASALGRTDLIPDEWSLHPSLEAAIEAGVADGSIFSDSYVKTEDGPGWLTHPVDTERLRRYWTKGKGAAKIRWGVPGDFNRCRAQLAKYIKPIYLSGYCANRHYDALGFWPGRPVAGETIAASASTESFHLVASANEKWLPPREFYDNPNLIEPTTLTITDTGHVFGHLAEWGVCHIGMDGVCTTPPESETDYAFFAKGKQATTDGDVRVGVLTLGTGHAGPNLRWSAAAAHYDNTGSICATVAIGEDDIGIWFSGALPPWVTEDQIAQMRAVAAVSGDWRRIGEYMELVAGLVVNVPGFPIPATQIAASGGRQMALVASGIVMHQECRPIAEIVGEAVEAHLEMLERRKAMAALAVEARRDPASLMAALAAERM